MAMSDYTPSFYDGGASRREPGGRGGYGGGGYGNIGYGRYGGGGGGEGGGGGYSDLRTPGAYISTSSFDYGNNNKINAGAGSSMPGPYNSNFRRPHANMMSTDREQMMRMQAQQLQAERQQQVEEKRRREIEQKERERLEDQQLEENIRRQQEKMRMEYEEEINRRKKKEEEQKRRREAQVAHLEAMRLRAEEEKKNRLVGSHRKADTSNAGSDPYNSGRPTTSVVEPDDRRSRFVGVQDDGRDGREAARRTSIGGRSRRGRERTDDQRPLRSDDFGLNLGHAAYQTHLSTALPNRFFDRENPETVAQPPPPPPPHFDWRVKVDNISEEEKDKLNQMSEEEMRNFSERNTDVMSQLNAMKRDLRTGAGRDEDEVRSSSPGLRDIPSTGFGDTIPAGPGGADVDYFKVSTAPSSPDNTRRADRANNRRRAQASSLDLDGTSGTVLRKYLEHTKATIQS